MGTDEFDTEYYNGIRIITCYIGLYIKLVAINSII